MRCGLGPNFTAYSRLVTSIGWSASSLPPPLRSLPSAAGPPRPHPDLISNRRTHGRLAVEQLRKIKVHFLLRAGGPASGRGRLIVLSRGGTLAGWVADLKAHPSCPAEVGAASNLPPVMRMTNMMGDRLNSHPLCPKVIAADWKPGRKGPAPVPQPARLPPAKAGTVLRLWAFGKADVQRRVREQVVDWSEMDDLFVA